MRRAEGQLGWWAVAGVALLAGVVAGPLLRHPSCGHDFGFHVQSWIDAAGQMRQGKLYPQWTVSAAYNAGEPRFVFYPPLSWMLGAVLMLVLPTGAVPGVVTFVSLLLAGLGMLALARRYASGSVALLAATAYVVNPYLLFTAYERTAFGELLAAAWMPWMLRAALEERPRWWAVAWPVALLWLTNAPAAVMGTYTLVAVVLLRVLWTARERGKEGWSGWLRGQMGLVGPVGGGLLLGLALVSFYLVPAALERRYVQIGMAMISGMRVEDNFLFGHTGDPAHDAVLRTASWLAVMLLLTTGLLLLGAWRRAGDVNAGRSVRARVAVLGVFAVGVAVLLLRASLPVWHVLPELRFLQFPWRWLAVLGCVLGAAVAMWLRSWRVPVAAVLVFCVLAGVGAAGVGQRQFRQMCGVNELPAEAAAMLRTHHGTMPTDEYTPMDADNDQQRWDEPGWWLSEDANAPGPGSIPNPAATIVNYDVPPRPEQTVAGMAPMQLLVQLRAPEALILNLRAFPAWVVTVNGRPAEWLQRDDGLVAVALPAGEDAVRVRWRRMPEDWAGDAVSLAALMVAGGLGLRARRLRVR